MCKLRLEVLILFVCLSHSLSLQSEPQEQPYEIESFTFAQHWPVTECKLWTYVTHPGGSCSFPRKPNHWTVHGLWPKINRTPSGYCNDSWPLDREMIDDLEIKLNQTWTNIYKESEHYSLWDHEWRKHGTCATAHKSLNTQYKYFNKGINWNHKYSFRTMFRDAGLLPSDTKPVTPEEIVAAIKTVTKKLPMIVCETIFDVQYLDELRLCFDNMLNITDCHPVVDDTCNKSKDIIYAATV
ncbi:hypothetical protein B5X24_HaOG206855 [Helicoverpa armigera]|uniref:Uncharacterized protein n=1 Tax=Helicoverpa armigera TaxID=29058 RepID=A0A2W1BMZ0_HELAM|nr:hypothetical protein B5X24_HaOG206855 [Helicoverpa armigera]